MATDTETLSLPTTTAPTDVATSACMPHDKLSPRGGEWNGDEWDTNITPGIHIPTKLPSCSGCNGTQQNPMAMMMNHQRQHQHQHQQQHPQEQQLEEDEGSDTTMGKYVIKSRMINPAGPLKKPKRKCQNRKSWKGRLTSDLLLSSSRSVEESCKRALEHFPCPTVAFPMPTLEFDFRIAVALNPEPSRIENRVQKEITTIKGGMWSGSFGNGRVMAGGYDLGQARGFRPIRIVEGAFVLQTTDQPPALLEMRTRGSLSGPCEVLDTLLSARESKENIDPRQYGFRTFATVKTSDKRYAEFVNCSLWVASGVWRGEELIIDAYRLT